MACFANYVVGLQTLANVKTEGEALNPSILNIDSKGWQNCEKVGAGSVAFCYSELQQVAISYNNLSPRMGISHHSLLCYVVSSAHIQK